MRVVITELLFSGSIGLFAHGFLWNIHQFILWLTFKLSKCFYPSGCEPALHQSVMQQASKVWIAVDLPPLEVHFLVNYFLLQVAVIPALALEQNMLPLLTGPRCALRTPQPTHELRRGTRPGRGGFRE